VEARGLFTGEGEDGVRHDGGPHGLTIPSHILDSWQDIVDLLVDLIDVPAALIMHVHDPDIEVFVASRNESNPYVAGDSEHVWGSGLYCETVLKTKEKLLLPDARLDPGWDHNPDIELGMISYLGLPIMLPDGEPFGTICVLDNRPNGYSARYEALLAKMRDLIESELEMVHVNQILGDEHRRLSDYLGELQALRGLVAICSHCKSLRDEGGAWHPIEEYLVDHPHADFTHSICPTCMKEHYSEF
jgi:GAF domain-containing protein